MALVPAAAGSIQSSGHVAQGVYSLGQDFGHMPSAEVAPAVKAAFDEYARRPFYVRYGEAAIPILPADLGVSLDLAATTRRILDGTAEDDLGDRIGRVFGRPPAREVYPALNIDDSRLAKTAKLIAEALDRPAVDADLAVSPKGVTLRPAQSARRVDVSGTAQRLRGHLALARTGDVEAAVAELAPKVRDADWTGAAEVASVITSAPIELRHEERSWTLSSKDLASALTIKRPDAAGQPGAVKLDEAKLTAWVASVAKEVDKPAVDARVERRGERFAVIGAAEGLKVNQPATVALVEAAVLSTKRRVSLVVGAAAPGVTASDWQEATELANRASGSPIRLTFRGRTWSIAATKLADMVTFTRTQVTPATYRVGLDEAQLAELLRPVAKEIDRPARDARLKVLSGTVTVAAEAQDGYRTDLSSTVAAVARGAFGDERSVPAAVSAIAPKITAADVANVKLPDLVGEASTSYAGSIAERAHNVELATARLNGTLVPPDGVFSFNESVGPTTLASGYQIGYGISLKDGQAITVPSEAGGICQVATTVFQAAFWAGLPIVERQSHIYWITRYASPPGDIPGLDATVDDPYLDFKFRNTTGGWLLVESATDGGNVRFTLRGRKPAWEVKVDQPAISSVVKANPAAVRQDDPTMPKGKELWVEHAEDGFVSRLHRTVIAGGKVVDSLDVVSYYRPAQNVLLVGTLEISPTAAITTTPAITATGAITTSPAISATPAITP